MPNMLNNTTIILWSGGGVPWGIVALVLECDIISKFKPQLHYYVHFGTNTSGISMSPLPP